MSDLPPDPLEGQIADAELLYATVMGSVDYGIWTGTGGTTGCALCKGLTFKERIAKGGHHITCAEELAVDKGARNVKYGMSCGDLMARLIDIAADPRLGEWKRHLDQWSELR